MLSIPPLKNYDQDNEFEFREDVRRRWNQSYKTTGDLVVPLGKRLAFTSPQGQVITFGYNTDGNFTIQQDSSTPFGLASLSFVATVESTLTASIATLETTLTADINDLSASVTTIATAQADLETAFAALEVDVEAANDAAAAAASSALAAAASQTAAGSSASAAATSATNAATSASNASTSASQASTSETNAAGSAATATTQATNAANSATAAGGSASAAATSASTAATQATNASNSASAAQASSVSAQSVANRILPERVSVAADFVLGNPNGSPDSATPTTLGSVVTVAGDGEVREVVSTVGVLATRGMLAVGSGRTFRCSSRLRVTVDGTGDALRISFGAYDASYTFLGNVNLTDIDATPTVAEGWYNSVIETTSALILAAYPTAAYIRGRAGQVGTTTTRTWQIAFLRLQDITSEAAAAGSASAAAGSASSAATSASAADTSATAASTSATSAATQASNAATSASQASTSASQASTSATNAAGSASSASTSATNAAASQSAAAGSASAAATSASTASTQATNASNSASAASASSVSARSVAASVFPSTFENQTTFTENIAGLSPTPFSGSDSRFSSVSGEGIVYTTDGDAACMATLGLIRPVAGRTYKVTSRVRVTVNPTVRTTDTYVGFHTMDASGVSVSYSGTVNYYGIVAADGWRNLSHTVTGDTLLTLGALARPLAILNWNDGGGSPGDSTGNYFTDSTMQVAYLKLEDITESQSAAGSASASATSASSAATSASAAGASASAANTSATNAATSASNASTSASQASTSAGNAASSASSAATQASNAAASATTATTQASNASASAAAASNSATLSATYAQGSQGSINSSATFADNANATGVPTNWFEWANAAADGTRQTGIAPQPYAYQQAGRAGENGGIYQPLFGRFSAGWHVIEADITLVSGALTGAGVLLNADPASVYTEYPLSFSTDPDVNGSVVGAGATGVLYKFRKLVQVGLGVTYNHIYAMSHYGAFGSTAAANSIKFHRVAVRPASQAEIEARQAKLDLVTANANIATNASAIATETSARAAADTSLSARINVKSNRFPYPQPLNDTVPSGWYHTGLTIGTWQPLGGKFYYKTRPSGGSALTEYYFYDLEPTNTAWIDASNQYTLSAIGYGGAGVAGDRLRMRIELLDSGGTIIHASPYVLLNAYYPDTRPSTTTTYSGAGEYVRRRVVFEREWASSGSYQDTVFNYIKFESGPVATAYTSEGATETLQAAVTTNASAIATESSARAAADTTLTASLGTTNANVSTNASAIATIQGAAAYWETVVSAGGGDLAAVRLKAGASGSYLELISTVLRLANVSNGAVIEVMRAISGEAYFSRPISADGGGKRVTVGPGYGVSGSQVVLWFGADTVAPSSQSRTNGFFALGTDGKIYYGTTELTNPTVSVFTKSASTTSISTSGTTVATLATIDVNDVPAGGFLALLQATLPSGSWTLSSGTQWLGNLIITEQLQSGGTEYTRHTIAVDISDTGGGFYDVTYDGGNDAAFTFPKAPAAQNVSGNCRYRLKLQRTSGTNNISSSPSALVPNFIIQRTPG